MTEPETAAAHLPAIIHAVLRPEAYSHAADDIRVHETHISWVILAGPYAYKLKKPLDLGFLDFSSLARRAAACGEEVRLNRRLCPDIYLGRVDVVERDGAYLVGGPGRVVEPAVWMRRMPEEGMLVNLLERDAVKAPLVRRIARRLARFHASAATGPGVDEHASPAALAAVWWQNFAQAQPFVGRTLAPAAFRPIGPGAPGVGRHPKATAGLPPGGRVGAAFGRGLYDPAMTRRTYATLRGRAARWLRRGYPVVVDATCGQPAQRAALRRVAARAKAAWCCCSARPTRRRRSSGWGRILRRFSPQNDIRNDLNCKKTHHCHSERSEESVLGATDSASLTVPEYVSALTKRAVPHGEGGPRYPFGGPVGSRSASLWS